MIAQTVTRPVTHTANPPAAFLFPPTEPVPTPQTAPGAAEMPRQVMDLYILPGGDGGYSVRLHSNMGASQGRLARTILDLPGQFSDPKELGSALFAALFQGPLFARYISVRDHARLTQQECHIRLHLQETPELAALPWETLYDADRRAFLALSSLTPVVRFFQLAQPDPAQQVTWPIKILGMVSAPDDVAHLDAEAERRSIDAAVAEINAQHGAQVVQVRWLHDATPRALQNALREEQFHIFHFIGHGLFDKAAQSGCLILEDAQNQPVLLSAQALALLLQDHVTLRLAVINACQGATAGSGCAFAGVAQALIQAGLPAAIAMQDAISDGAATLFAQEFYGTLADGKRVHYAVGEARKAIFVSGNMTEWATPVLFSQIEDGQIFQMPAQQTAPARPISARPQVETGYAISMRALMGASRVNAGWVH